MLIMHVSYAFLFDHQHLLKQYALSQDPGRKEFLDNLVAYFAKEGNFDDVIICWLVF